MSERGDLRVNLTGNSAGFTSMLNQARGAARKFGDELKSGWSVGSVAGGLFGGLLGAASFQGFKDLMKGSFEGATQIKDLAEQFDLSTDSVQRWEKALGKAGIDSTKFYTALDRLRAKREEVRNDPSKGGLFDMLGMTGDAINPDVSDEDFLKKLLKSGASRPQLNEMLGRGGARLGAAVPYLGSSVPLSEDDIRTLDDAGRNLGGIGKALKGFASKSSAFFSHALTSEFWGDLGTWATKGYGVMQAMRSAREESLATDRENAQKRDSDSIIEAAEYEQLLRDETKSSAAREKLATTKEKLRQVERQGMTPGGARADRAKEIGELNARIKYYDEVKNGLSPADLDKLTGLKIQRAQLMHDQRQSPPSLNVDNLTRAGLYSSSTISFNPVLGVQQQQLNVQKQMLTRLEKIESVH